MPSGKPAAFSWPLFVAQVEVEARIWRLRSRLVRKAHAQRRYQNHHQHPSDRYCHDLQHRELLVTDGSASCGLRHKQIALLIAQVEVEAGTRWLRVRLVREGHAHGPHDDHHQHSGDRYCYDLQHRRLLSPMERLQPLE
jgi:hypothetical protein